MAKSANNIRNGVSVILPTFRRPEGLQIALKSLVRQNAGGLALEIIVADNDPKGSAKAYVKKFAASTTVNIRYLHIPEPGVSNARNGALKAAKGRYLAFLDDDQEAGANWLETLLDSAKKYGAGLAFVPTIARIPGSSIYDDYYTRFFSRFGPDMDEGIVDDFFGCGNSLLDTKLCTLPTPPFSVDMNETGGEDDMLFGELQAQGIKIAWSRNAKCYEDIRPHRATPGYVKIRSFANGQSPSQEAAESNNWLGIIKWMMVGAVQYAAFTPITLLTKALGKPSYIHYLAKSSSGAGKVLWFGGFTPKLYGAAVVDNKAF
ncbi:MAG: glycosyltransferase family 2 protein [Robiginitomaculum sp.]|nr:glycosyltransferase family 2 protein [Robiginitomaculum sp.]